jgi:acetyl esterase/lipase
MTQIDRRLFLGAGAALLGSAALPGIGIAAASPVSGAVDPMSLVHPELKEALQRFAAFEKDAPPLSDATLSQQRAMMQRFFEAPIEGIPFEERQIPGAPGQPAVRVFVINASGTTPRPLILHTHGGGFVSGEAHASIRPMQQLARELDCVVITVDYRLAPESRWQASLAENYAALRWAHTEAGTLGIDRSRIALLGESAGGGHAALLALTARDRGEVPLAAQILIYPMLDDRTGSTRAVPPHIGSFGWKATANRYGWRSFLGVEPGSGRVPTAAVPSRARRVDGLPRTFIGVGSIDLFVEEDIGYAQRLIAAGVDTELLVVPGAFHGFDFAAPDSNLAKTFRAAWTGTLRRAFGKA